MAGSFSRVAIGAFADIKGAACVAVAAETLMYQDRSMPPTTLQCLMD